MLRRYSLRARRHHSGSPWLAVLVLAACTELESADDRFEAAGTAGASGESSTAGTGNEGSGANAGSGNAAGLGGGGASGGSTNGGSSGTRSAGEAGEGPSSGAGGRAGTGAGTAGRTEEGGEAGEDSKGGSGGCPPVAEREVVALGPGEVVVDRDTTWNCETIHALDGTLLVAPGVTLTLEAGSLVQVARGGLFLVQRRGRLLANGTAEAPIVFTSALPEGERAAGDWRGVVLIGDAPTHSVNAPVYNTLGDGRADYGGGPEGDPDGSCGRLHYVRVEFAGGNVGEAANPGAALTLAGCGAQTEVDFVQVHRATDGIGLVGGTVGLRHAVVTANQLGNAIEWTGGYRGDLQFLIAQSLGAAPSVLGSNSEGDQGKEPVSNPRIYNALLVGSAPLVTGSHFGLELRFGSGATFKNSVITGFADAAFDLADVMESDVGPGLAVDISHVLMFENAKNYTDGAAVLAGMASMRQGDPGLPLADESAAPTFLPLGSEVSIEPAPAPRPFDTTAGFRGAMAPGSLDWTTGWTLFPSP